GSVGSADAYQNQPTRTVEITSDPEREAVESLVGPADEAGCRPWRGSIDKRGYPRAWWRGRYVRAGRLLYGWKRGEIPSGYTLDHLCRHRWCVAAREFTALPAVEKPARETGRAHVCTPVTWPYRMPRTARKKKN